MPVWREKTQSRSARGLGAGGLRHLEAEKAGSVGARAGGFRGERLKRELCGFSPVPSMELEARSRGEGAQRGSAGRVAGERSREAGHGHDDAGFKAKSPEGVTGP